MIKSYVRWCLGTGTQISKTQYHLMKKIISLSPSTEQQVSFSKPIHLSLTLLALLLVKSIQYGHTKVIYWFN